MPISHETLLLAKKYTDQLHAGGGTHYTGGHGIIVEGESIKIDVDVVVEQNDIQEVNESIALINQTIQQIDNSLNQTQSSLSSTQSSLSTLSQNVSENIQRLDAKDSDLQTQIDNLENGTTAIPVATAGKPGIVMPRQGLVVDRSGALNTTIQQYLDLTCGTIFLAPGQSKTIKLYHPCFIIYLEFYLVDSTNVASPYLLYMSNVTEGTITKGYLTATFDKQNGTYVSLTNKHTTNAMFVHYGCDDLKQTDD